MNLWHEAISYLEARNEAYVLVTLLGTRGSTPRNSGTKMIVSATKSYCTIGGGHLEFQAIAKAQALLKNSQLSGENTQEIEHFPLGARLGQCCGGSASVLFESFSAAEANIMLFGAGHVGKALVSILAQLPCRVQWVDSREEEFPDSLPGNTTRIISEAPEAEVAVSPAGTYYLVMTHNHPLDFAITQAALERKAAAYIGLIGSITKWQRFKMRFEHRQYDAKFYDSVRCPVGLSQVPGKLPMEVAVSIAGEIIADYQAKQNDKPVQQGIHWRDLKSLAINNSDVNPLSSQTIEVPTS